MTRTSSNQCAWCPWDCASPEVAACRTGTDELSPAPTPAVPAVLDGVCEPRWAQVRTMSTRTLKAVDVIRDLADYEERNAPD